MNHTKEILVGTLLGTALGSLSMFLYPKTKNNFFQTEEKAQNHSFLTGSVLGLLAGAGTAMFFSNGTRKEIQTQLNKIYHGLSDKVQDYSHRPSSKKKARKIRPKKAIKAKH